MILARGWKNPWKRIADPETDLCIIYLAYDKDDYFKSEGKRQISQQMVLLQWAVHLEKN